MTATQRAAMQQALEYMKSVGEMDMYQDEWAIVGRLEAALAQQAEPEPVESTEPIWQTLAEIGASAPAGTWDAPVATPPALQPLTTDQIVKLWNESIANGAVLGLSDTVLFARAVEHAHGIKEAK